MISDCQPLEKYLAATGPAPNQPRDHHLLSRQAMQEKKALSPRGWGASQGFPRAAAPVGVFSQGTTRISGSLSCGAREVRSPCAWPLAAHKLLEQATVPYVQDESENRRLNHYSFLPILAQLHGSSTLDKCDEEAELPFPQLPVKGYDTIPGGVGHHHFLSPRSDPGK